MIHEKMLMLPDRLIGSRLYFELNGKMTFSLKKEEDNFQTIFIIRISNSKSTRIERLYLRRLILEKNGMVNLFLTNNLADSIIKGFMEIFSKNEASD